MLNATIVLKDHFINSHKYNFIAKVIKHLMLMKFSNLNSTLFSLFLKKEQIYFSYIKKQKIRKNAFKHHQLLKKTNETKYCEKSSQRGLKRDRRGAKANNNRRTRGMIKTKRHAKGRGRKRE